MTKFRDTSIAKGAVRIDAVYPDGTKKLLWSNHNTLTSNFFALMAQMMAGEVGNMIGTGLRTVQTGTAKWASFMKIGSGTTPAFASDTDVEAAILDNGTGSAKQLNIASVSYATPYPGSVTFTATLEGGANDDNFNTTPLTEVGLFSESGIMLARQVYSAISKTATFQLQYTWTITFRS